MGCCVSSPHNKRRYYDPADLDEEFVLEGELPLRTFGRYRGNQVIVPDDIDGLPSTRDLPTLATDPDTLLYDAEIDNGRAWRCLRPCWAAVPFWPMAAVQCLACGGCSCDEMLCWVRKEYSTRNYFRVYANRIEVNNPRARIPWGLLGCGSWSADDVVAHPFDRGAFGFHRVKSGICALWCCFSPMYGESVGRQRCQCNGPVWHGGWWCDEWPCSISPCTFRYHGLADGDEVAFAANLALQAYFEGRKINPEDMEKCLEYWHKNASEFHDPVNHKRDVMCEPFFVPCVPTVGLYRNICQCPRRVPYREEDTTREMKKVYNKYERLRQQQIGRYTNFKYPVRYSTICRAMGCRRLFGRKGLIFCTEGCNDNKAAGCCYTKLGMQSEDPFAPPSHPDLDDHCNAAHVLQAVLGDPPQNVVYRRWVWDSDANCYTVATRQGAESKEPDKTDELSFLTASGPSGQDGLSQRCNCLIQKDEPPTVELSLVQDEAPVVTAVPVYKGKF